MANSMQIPPYLQLIPGSKSSTPTSQSTSQTTTTSPTEAPTVTVDPGQVIRINARFPGQPDSVHFSLLPPQSDVALYDPGVHEEGSKIQQDGDLFYYVIDTSNMRGGLGWWYFCSKDTDPEKRRAKVGKFIVRDVPTELYSNGEELLGASSDETKPVKSMWPSMIESGLGAAAFGALLGYGLAPRVPARAISRVRSKAVVKIIDRSSGIAAWVALGIAVASALGYWLWRRHQEAKLTAHVGEEEDCAYDLLMGGAD